MKFARSIVAAASVVVAAGSSIAYAVTPASAYSGNEKIQNVTLTLYGGQDGDNITGDNNNARGIAWPKNEGNPTSIHNLAGGQGTWSDPTTIAVADPAHGGPFAKGTRFYIPAVHRYFIAEDTCHECLLDWHKGAFHVDMWAGKNATTSSMDNYPANGKHTIIVNPNSNYQVDPGPLLTH